MAKLAIFRGDAVEREIHLSGNTVRIGRHQRNDVVLDDSSNGVSRFHAEIRNEAGTYFIVDLNSRNGVWINGRRLTEKTALAVGVPATVGAFELVLEDEVSSGELDVPFDSQHTERNAASVGQTGRTTNSRTQSGSPLSRLTASQRQVLLWVGAAAAVLLVCIVTFVVVRYESRPAPVATIDQPRPLPPEPPPVVPAAEPPAEPPAVPPAPEVSPTKTEIDRHLEDARAQIGAGDYAGALRDHLQVVLERDPDNIDALALKKQVEEALNQAPPKKTPPDVAKATQPAEPEAPGIPKRPNESREDYQARSIRIQRAFADGKSNLEKQEFSAALNQFRSVKRDAPKFTGIDSTIREAESQQQKALETALNDGDSNERAGKLREARQSYQRAMKINPDSTTAREKHEALVNRLTVDARKLYDGANAARKMGDNIRAAGQLQQIMELLQRGDEIREKAAKDLEGLKQ